MEAREKRSSSRGSIKWKKRAGQRAFAMASLWAWQSRTGGNDGLVSYPPPEVLMEREKEEMGREIKADWVSAKTRRNKSDPGKERTKVCGKQGQERERAAVVFEAELQKTRGLNDSRNAPSAPAGARPKGASARPGAKMGWDGRDGRDLD